MFGERTDYIHTLYATSPRGLIEDDAEKMKGF
jgi:hypothetical protein